VALMPQWRQDYPIYRPPTWATAMIGRDSILGGAAAIDGSISLNKAIVQLGGNGETLDVARLREVADKSPDFWTTLIRREQVLFLNDAPILVSP
jgi:hypothetical protein